MKNPKVYLTSLIITIIATLALATGTILILMFSVHDNESAHLTGLFGSVYFQSSVEHSHNTCLLYTSPSPRDQRGSRMPSSA